MDITNFLKLKQYKNTCIWTFCNYGYRFYTLNLYLSLQKLSLERYLSIFVTDFETETFFKSFNIDCFCIDNSCTNSALCQFWTDDFNNISKVKFDIASMLLDFEMNQLFIDGDIVIFNNNIFDYVIDKMKHNIVIQDDRLNSRKPEKHCTGFFGVNFSFNILFRKLIDNYKNINQNDQYIYNQNLSILRKSNNIPISIEVLDRNLFPNGAVIQQKNFIDDSMFLVHFNYFLGNEKKYIMTSMKSWFVDQKFT